MPVVDRPVCDGLLHGLPDLPEEVPDFRAFVHLHVLAEGIDVAPFAEVPDLRKGVFRVDLGRRVCGPPQDDDVAATHGFDPDMSGLVWPLIGEEVHGIGVLDAYRVLLGKDDFRVYLLQDLPQDPVCAVTDAGFAQGAVKDDFDAVGLWMLRKKQPGGRSGPMVWELEGPRPIL